MLFIIRFILLKINQIRYWYTLYMDVIKSGSIHLCLIKMASTVIARHKIWATIEKAKPI